MKVTYSKHGIKIGSFSSELAARTSMSSLRTGILHNEAERQLSNLVDGLMLSVTNKATATGTAIKLLKKIRPQLSKILMLALADAALPSATIVQTKNKFYISITNISTI